MTASNEFEGLRDHLLKCHSVDPQSEAMRFALKTLEDVKRQFNNNTADSKEMTKRSIPSNGIGNDFACGGVKTTSDTDQARSTNAQHDDRDAYPKNEIPMSPSRTWKHSIWGTILTTIRFIVIEFPLVILFALGVSSVLFAHVYDTYWDPQFDLMTYTDENRTADLTYYHRQCTPNDISTDSIDDLIIHSDFTTQEKVEHMLIHGMSVYQNILNDDTATNLRSWILERNKSLNKKDEIDVISNENRWSFYIGANDNEFVTRALKEVATHEVFRPALERIVGRNPAIIEMTAITSAYGAGDQFWHHDIIPDGSPAKLGRSFIPSYSLFMTLQDTSAEMGATDLCPGTHMCGGSDAELVCAGNSFQASGGSYWKGGNALFMNQQTYHRGAAHSDPNGPHRVLFILTFAPRPMDALYETRMIGAGGSYSLRFDMWGHTLDDFEHATTKITQPWATLRGLGLYKPRRSEWGWDWVSQTSMRMANSDTGYYDENLDDFVSKGGLGLPKILTPVLREGMKWRDYCDASVNLWRDIIVKANTIGYAVFLSVTMVIGITVQIFGQRHTVGSGPLRKAFRSIGRVARMDAIIVAIALLILHKTNQSSWAKAIRSKTLYTSPFPTVQSPQDPRPLAVVFSNDVLITDRLDVKYLGSLSDVIEYHGGNLAFRSTIKGVSDFAKWRSRDDVSRLAHSIVNGMKREGSRLLFQNEFTDFVALSDADSVGYTTQAILLEANPLIAALHKESRFLLSSYKHGLKYRYCGALAQHHSIMNINAFLNKLMDHNGVPIYSLYAVPTLLPRKAIRVVKTKLKRATLQTTLSAVFRPRVKSDGASFMKRTLHSLPIDVKISNEGMLQIGDTVDAQYNGMYNEYYKGKIISVSQGSVVSVQYFDGELDSDLAPHHITKWRPYAVGEILEVKASSNGEFQRAEVLKSVQNGKVLVELLNNGRHANVRETWIRRIKLAEPGDVVECPFEGSDRLFKGTVVKINTDGTYHVKFFDGDVDYRVHPNDVLLVD